MINRMNTMTSEQELKFREGLRKICEESTASGKQFSIKLSIDENGDVKMEKTEITETGDN